MVAVTNEFFAQPNLPPEVKLMEQSVRYGTLVWIAWYLNFTGHKAETIDYLKQAWKYRANSGIEIIVTWVESFGEFSRNWGVEFEVDELTSSTQWQQLVQWIVHSTSKIERAT